MVSRATARVAPTFIFASSKQACGILLISRNINCLILPLLYFAREMAMGSWLEQEYGILAFEKLDERRSEDVYQRLSPVVKKRMTGSSDHDERGHGNRSPLPECRWITAHGISHDGAVVGDRMRHRLYLRPHWRVSHLGNHFGRHEHRIGHEVLDCFTPATCRDQLVEMRYVILRHRRAAVVDNEWGLIDRQFLDLAVEQARCFQGQNRAGGMTENERGSTGLVDESFDIFDLALDRIGGRISTVAPATAVVGEDGKVRRKVSRKCCLSYSSGSGTGHQDERGSDARLIEGDSGAIFGIDCSHGVLQSLLLFLEFLQVVVQAMKPLIP